MNPSTHHVPTDAQPEDPSVPNPIADIALALTGAAITSPQAVAAIDTAVRSTVAVVQPVVSNWLRIAARSFRF